MSQTHTYETPSLKSELTTPLLLLEKRLIQKENDIEAWFNAEWKKSPPPVYGSVDLRNAGFKLAPVDMNLFPAGFNNLRLNPSFIPIAIDAARATIKALNPNAQNILLIPESHTRNTFYWENVGSLVKILTDAGFFVRIGSLQPDLVLPDGLEIEPIKRQGDQVTLENFMPDLVLLNNDLSAGIPDILQNLAQPIVPPAELGWSQRLKSEHFHHYAEIADEFARLIDIDPWLISPISRSCGKIDFMMREGEECLVKNVGTLLEDIQRKYDEYHITQAPYVVVKANAGTYGMAVMMVKSVDEIQSLNRKQRTSMSRSKSGQPVHSVIVQEGIYTFETIGADNVVAEPVVYLWGERVVGGFYRVHKERGVDENLNSPGMQFEPLAFPKTCHKPSPVIQESGECENRYYAYGVIARLSMLAAAREILHQKHA